MIKIVCNDDNKTQSEFYKKIAELAFKHLSLSGTCAVELIFASGDEIRELNAKHRNIDKETDVLSFPTIDFSAGINRFDKAHYAVDFDPSIGAVSLGSIVINEPLALLQSEEYGHSYVREKGYLFLHGLLHLLGYDHIHERDKSIMRDLEERILSKLNLSKDIKEGE